MIGAYYIANSLKNLGIKKVYLYPGGTIAPLLDELVKCGIEYYCAINEQGAGYAAIGAAKLTGETQVVLVTSGPGATNLLTCIADAYYDSVPILAITGQVGTRDMNIDNKLRQTGFQETRTTDIFKPVTKKSIVLKLDNDIVQNVADAFLLTRIDRPGPVIIDLPMDVQRTNLERDIDLSLVKVATIQTTTNKPAKQDIERMFGLLADAKRPLILAGNGLYISSSVEQFRTFVVDFQLPVVSSMPGLGVLPTDHPLAYSYVGHTGEYFSNLALFHADLLIVLGARLDVRQTGSELRTFIQDKKIVRVDIDGSELEFGRVHADISINCDLKMFFDSMGTNTRKPHYSGWIEQLDRWRSAQNSVHFFEKEKLSEYHVIDSVNEKTKGKKVVVTSGVGSHQQFAARYFTYNFPDRLWMTSAGHGTMGYDIPANIGVLLNDTKRLGIVFVGDGSFQMNIQELAAIVEYKLPIKIFVLDNSSLGIVAQFQNLNWSKAPSTSNKVNPSFSAIAKAYGMKGYDLHDKEEIPGILDQVFTDNAPVLVHCHISNKEGVLPMLLAGQHLNQMHPTNQRIDL